MFIKGLFHKIHYFNNKELIGTFFVTAGTLFGSFFSYLLQFFLARYLNVGEYGEFNALLSLAYIAGVPATVLSTAMIKKVSQLLSGNEWKKLSSLFVSSFYFSVLIGLVIFASVYFFRGYISQTLKIGNIFLIVIFGMWLGLSFLLTVPGAYLLGLLRYKAYALFVSISSMLRFVFPALLVVVGYGLIGTFYGLSLSVILAFIISLVLLKKNLTNVRNELNKMSPELNDVFKLIMPIVLVNLCMMLLNNIDLVLVKRFFEAETAGYYAGVVTLGKILLFGAGTITVVMFPKISSVKNDTKKLIKSFGFFLSLQLMAVIAGVLVYLIFPRYITLIFFGSKFMESVKYLSLFSVFVGIYVIINFLVMFMLAIDQTRIYLLLLPGVIAQYVLINMFHGSLEQVIYINIYILLLIAVILGLYSAVLFKRNFKSLELS
ncbi:hypothetical protein A2415_00650 [candidate division WWE3 bacterium RIFOXYC1_FULL_39_7]|uniref:Polysaccharide biosynthesis protein C-terminal domain-containing protein n=1 Tax=candidate division WWE3 bacterium RIFOXYC1_FULL_39_7 TaxID=1802643 RepID=A0A1F4WMG8_UNCKA|nr:MAG: hypothetical protein A2415_00650 [candidate division WWE3 bacterium RIFOXYC1_FULL_39_7]